MEGKATLEDDGAGSTDGIDKVDKTLSGKPPGQSLVQRCIQQEQDNEVGLATRLGPVTSTVPVLHQ